MTALGKARAPGRAFCAFTLCLVFVVGAVAGAGVYRAYGSSRKPSAPFWTEAGKAHSMEKWKRELNLTPDQAKEVESILDDFTMYYRSVLSDGKARILKILSEEQRKKFEKLLIESQR